MNKISLNILPGLKKWFVEKTSILTAWNTTASDSQIPSEKLVKTELDKKATIENMDAALRGKIDKTSIKTVVNDTLTNDDVVGGKAVYDEIKKVEAGIPSGMKHTDITDWDTATAGFEKSTNNTTTISTNNASDVKYPTEKAVKLAIGDLQAHVEEKYPLKTSVNADLNTKIDKASIKATITDALTNEDVVGGKALYDEIQAVKADIPTSITHTQISDWATATNGFEKGANKATSLASPDNTKYPTTKAVSDGLATAKTNADNTYATKTELTEGLNTKLNTSAKTTELSNTSSDTQIPSAKAVYDLYSTIPKWHVEMVASIEELPVTGVIGTIYLVSDSGSGKNQYKEFFWNDSASEPGYEQFGGVEIDVSKFITKKQMTDYLANNSTLTLSADGELALNIVDATE